jgi:hypothetical protein
MFIKSGLLSSRILLSKSSKKYIEKIKYFTFITKCSYKLKGHDKQSKTKPFSIHLTDILGEISDKYKQQIIKHGTVNLKHFSKNRLSVKCLENSQFQTKYQDSNNSTVYEKLASKKKLKIYVFCYSIFMFTIRFKKFLVQKSKR